MLPLRAAEGIGVIPWSPQARGRLTRDWDYTSIRTETDDAHQRLFWKSEEADRRVVGSRCRSRCGARHPAGTGSSVANVAPALIF
jgi:aryl-alcohol dehydrogenase-like predicted oxidoreductase